MNVIIRFAQFVLIIALLGMFASCAASSDEEKGASSKDTAVVTQISDTPQFAATIFINNHKYGATNGCKTGLAPQGKIKCGHPDAISEFSWVFVNHVDGKDRYLVKRLFPADLVGASTVEKEIDYSGATMTIFEDEVQKIIISPVEK